MSSNNIIRDEQDIFSLNNQTDTTSFADNFVKTAEPQNISVPVPEVNKTNSKPKYVSTFNPADEKKVSNRDICHPLPNHLVDDDHLEKCVDNLNEIAKEFKDDNDKLQSLKDMAANFYQIGLNTFGNDFSNFFINNAETISQYLVGAGGVPLRIKPLKTDISKSIDTLSGTTAIRYIRKLTGGGSVTKIPLWDSGIVVTLDAFTEAEILELNVALMSNNIILGRQTRGSVFTGDDVHIVMVIVEFILNHVIETTVIPSQLTKSSLQKQILVSDVPSLLTGALAAIYPNGYPIFHACINTAKDACDYVITANKRENGDYEPDSLLDFTKMLWIREDLFTTEDILHMSAAPNTHSLADIKSYQAKRLDKYKEQYKTLYDLHSTEKYNISVSFKTPTLFEYSTMANEWIRSAKATAERALQNNNDIPEENKIQYRNKIMSDYAKLTDMVKVQCWIDYLTVSSDDGLKTINDKSSIREILADLTNQDGISEALHLNMKEFKENFISSFTGINNFKCPKCGTGQTDPDSKYPSLIPINMCSFFLSLSQWKAELLNSM